MIDFSAPLLEWYSVNKRALPWRENNDAYHVWVSEIMLQQTRVGAVMAYYERFMAAFPTLEALSQAEEDRVLKLWEGLGYYSRARNLLRCAMEVVERYAGVFPQDIKELRSLPGIGEYTAAAIASLAFNLPYVAVDANVMRIHARLTACQTPVENPAYKKEVARELSALSPVLHGGDFSSALMELGETVCISTTPRCSLCPLQAYCQAFQRGETALYPQKSTKKQRRIEERNVLLLLQDNRIALRQRGDKGLLARLWEFPDGAPPIDAQPCGEAVHIFTHVEWHMKGYVVHNAPDGDYQWFTQEERQALAIPGAFRAFVKVAEKMGY